MFKNSTPLVITAACVFFMQPADVYSREVSLQAGVDARLEYNDNIFLTSQPHDDVTALVVTPALSGFIKEENWETSLKAALRSNNYSDQNLDSNDQLFDLTGSYNLERHIFSLNINHDLDSNLSSTSSDFGIVGQRVNRKSQSLSPQYTYLMTERSALILSYSYADVDYPDGEGTSFTPYIAETGSATVIYNLTEINRLTVSLQAVDYTSKNDLVTYQLLQSRVGIDHRFSETLTADFLAGVSRRDSTNLITQSFDFFGNVIVTTQEIDAENRGLVFDAGFTQLFENGQLEGRISRDDTTDSFGGLNQVNKFVLRYQQRLSSRWRYDANARYEEVTAISSGSQNTDRDTVFLEFISRYAISRDWDVNASYRYVVRKFKSDTSDDTSPDSNRIFFGLSYNFPALSTF